MENTTNTTPSLEQNQTQTKLKKKNPTGLIILIIIIAGSVGFFSYSFFFKKSDINLGTEKPLQTNSTQKPTNIEFSFFSSTNSAKPKKLNQDFIAKIYITGIIQDENKTYNQKWLLDTINNLKDDEFNKGIILFIDSPGGSVYESDEVYLTLSEYRKTKKPVWAYMGPLAASGGYYIACGAEYICANRNTLTGSIGVIAGQSIDLTQMFEKLGIKSKTFTAGKNKNMLNYNSPLTEEQEKIMQSIANECYEQFTTIVSTNRRLPINHVKELADGRIYTAQQALDNKLIDKICSFDNAASAMKEKLKLPEVQIIDYEYIPKTTWYDLLNSAFANIKPLSQSAEVKALEMLDSNIKYPAYLYK